MHDGGVSRVRLFRRFGLRLSALLALRLLRLGRLGHRLVSGIVEEDAAAGIAGHDVLIAADLVVLLRTQEHVAGGAVLRDSFSQCRLTYRDDSIVMLEH